MAKALETQLKDPNADLNTFMERITALIYWTEDIPKDAIIRDSANEQIPLPIETICWEGLYYFDNNL